MNDGPDSARFAAGDRLDLFGKGRSYASSHFFSRKAKPAGRFGFRSSGENSLPLFQITPAPFADLVYLTEGIRLSAPLERHFGFCVRRPKVPRTVQHVLKSKRKIHVSPRLAPNSNSDSIRTNGKFVKLDGTL